MRQDHAKQRKDDSLEKKRYSPPTVHLYGKVADLTRGGTGKGNDAGGGGPQTMTCWIAESLYGVHSPRTRLMRSWLTACHEEGRTWARIVVPAYRKCGRQIAAVVARSRYAEAVVRPLFDFGLQKAHDERAARLVRARQAARA